MKRLEGYLLELRKGGRDAFIEAHPNHFLVSHRSAAEVDGDDWGGFHTDAVHADVARLAAELSAEEARAMQQADEHRVLELSKSPDNPWRGRISIGRARNTDAVIGDASVSKLHAHIADTDDGPTLTDAGSRNGTQINGERLAPSKPMPLKPGDRVLLGQVELTFHTAASFVDFLTTLTRSD